MRSCYHQGCDSGSNPSLRNSEGIKFLAKTAQAVTLAVAELAGGIEACDLSAFYSEPHSTDELLPEQPRAKLPEAAEDIKNFPEETTETVPAKEIIEEDLSENLPTTPTLDPSHFWDSFWATSWPKIPGMARKQNISRIR